MKYMDFDIERIFVTYTEEDEDGYEHYKCGYKCIVFLQNCAKDAMPIDVFFIEDNSSRGNDDCWDILEIIKYIDTHYEELKGKERMSYVCRRKPF